MMLFVVAGPPLKPPPPPPPSPPDKQKVKNQMSNLGGATTARCPRIVCSSAQAAGLLSGERVDLTNKFSITRLRFAAPPQSQLQTIQQLATAARQQRRAH